MAWSDLLAIIAAEAGQAAADRIAERAAVELGGMRMTILKHPSVSREQAQGGDVAKAARKAGVSRSSMYRRLQPEPGPRMNGRIVR